MSHYALQVIANDRSTALRHEAEQWRLGRPERAVPSSPPARHRRFARRLTSLIAPGPVHLGTPQHPAKSRIGAR